MENKTDKKVIVENAKISNDIENSKISIVNENIIKIKLKDFHSVAYLEREKETTYKDKEVVFILPNGKEYK